MYLMTGTYYSEGKIKCNKIVYHFYIKFTNRNYFRPNFLTGGGSFCVHLERKNQMKESEETLKSKVLNLHR